MTTTNAATEAARSGAVTAQQIITAQMEAGMPRDRIMAHHHDVAASLYGDVRTPDGKAFADAYAETAESMLIEMRELDEPDRTPGAPHPDPRLAARGWHACDHGIYVRRDAVAAEREREAG